MPSEKRKGLIKKGEKVNTSVKIDGVLTQDPRGIYMCDYIIKTASDDLAKTRSTYCNIQHDYSINSILRSVGFRERKISSIFINANKKVGESVAKEQKIKQWS